MQKIFLSFLGLIVSATLFCQAPQLINYQAVIRNADGTVKGKESVEIVISILSGSIEGEEVYSETHTTTVNETGIVSLQIGSLIPLDERIFTTGDSLFLNMTVDGYDMGTSQLLSVPYAFIAGKSYSLAGTDGMGEGSGLDADLLDGKEASEFALASHTHASVDTSDMSGNSWRGDGNPNNPWYQVELSLRELRSDIDSLQQIIEILQGNGGDNRNNNEINHFRIEFRLRGTTASSNSTTGYVYHEYMYHDFNIANYKNCQSIKFAAYIATHDYNNTCYAELYNVTDDVVILRSTVSNDGVDFIWAESPNLINEFPEKDIDLTVRVRSKHGDKYVSLQSANLYISFSE